MNRFLLSFLLLVVCVHANKYVCGYDVNKDASSQIESCKLQILKETCEQQGINVWSTTNVNNNTLNADQIKTDASCKSIGVKITNIIFTDTTLVIAYKPIQETQEVHSVSMEQWNSIKVASSKTNAHATKVNRPDSTTLADLAVSIQIDSREIKKKFNELNDKSNRILGIIFE